MKLITTSKFCVILLLLLAFILPSRAQEMVNDTIPAEENHSPHKATIYSLVLPGLGQAYNKKYWKIPLIYIGFASIVYFIDWNNNNYADFRSAYSDLIDTDPETKSYEQFDIFDEDLADATARSQVQNNLLNATNYYRRNRDLLIISAFGFYALNIIDASVDAHFFNFDVSDDLTFNWQPSIYQYNNEKIFCINCTLNF